MPLFGKSKGSSEWVKTLKEGINNLEAAEGEAKKKEKVSSAEMFLPS